MRLGLLTLSSYSDAGQGHIIQNWFPPEAMGMRGLMCWCYLFHMPVFVMLSGYLGASSSMSSCKFAGRLLPPYITCQVGVLCRGVDLRMGAGAVFSCICGLSEDRGAVSKGLFFVLDGSVLRIMVSDCSCPVEATSSSGLPYSLAS